jgi:outer membrane protein assembly factor BamB
MPTRKQVRRAARPSSQRPLVDPQGLYGTRTAQRLRFAQRRQKLQKAAAFLLAVAFVAYFFSRWRAPRVQFLSSTSSTHLVGEPSAPAVFAGSKLLIPTQSGTLWSFNTNQRRLQRLFSAPMPLRAQPLVQDNIAYVPCENGTLYAVSLNNGRTLWSYGTNSSLSTRPAFTRVLDSEKGVTQAIVLLGSDSGGLFALDARSGKLRWRRNAGAPIGAGMATATRDGVVLLIAPLLGGASSRGGLLCLDARSGATIWRADLLAARVPAPVVAQSQNGGQRVYTVGDDGGVFCLDVASGRIIWKSFVPPLSNPNKAVVLRAEPLFKHYTWGQRLFVGGSDGALRSLDAESGKLLWTHETDAASTSIDSIQAPILLRPATYRLQSEGTTRDLLLFSSNDEIFTVDTRDGQPVSRAAVTGRMTAMLVQDDVLWGVSSTGAVQSFALKG